jgi:hypothetical protein
MVTEVKGIQKGQEWVANEVERALAYTPDGSVSVRWAEVDIPDSLRKRIVVSQSTRP